MNASDLLEEMRALVCEATRSGAAQYFLSGDEKTVYVWIGRDVFEIEKAEDEFLALRFQNVQCLLLPFTDSWDVISPAVRQAQSNDAVTFASRRAIVAAVVDRLRSFTEDGISGDRGRS